MKGATLHTTRERRMGKSTAGIMLAVCFLLGMCSWPDAEPAYAREYAQDEWRPIVGAIAPTWTRVKDGFVEYRFDDLGKVCRYRPAEWDKPKCEEVGK